jgi:hypothetical protein
MIWIPVIFFCLSGGHCTFSQGTPTYTEDGCKEQLAQASVRLQQEPLVVAFDGTCVTVVST